MKKIDENKSVWYAKYNPFFVEDMILPPKMKETIQKAVNTQKLKHYGFFSNKGGLGKSALCHAIIKEVNGEALWVNASKDRGIDVVKTGGLIAKFASQGSFDDKVKIVIMDEFDNFTPDGQKAFRGFIDEYGSNCTFIFTGNYKEKIIEQLLGRMEVYDFADFPKQEMVKPIYERLTYILENENVKWEQKDVLAVMTSYYPSIREMIGSLDKFTIDGVLTINKDDLDAQSSYTNVIKLMKPTTYFEMVQEINKLTSPNNMYNFLYTNADKLFPIQFYPQIIPILAQYEFQSIQSRDKHLQLNACLTQLMQFNK